MFLFGCGMIPVNGHGGEIAEAEASRGRGHGATETWRTDTAHGSCMRAVSSPNWIVGDGRIAETRREIC